MKIILMALIIFITQQNVLSKTILNLNANENLTEQTIAATLLKKLIPESDYELHIKPVPPSRANAQNTNLTIDGEIARISTYAEKNPTLLRVDPAYYYLTSEVFCTKNLQKTFSKKEELANFKIAAIRGVAHSDNQLVGHNKTHYTSNAEQMFDLLNIGRVDLVLDTGVNGAKILIKKQLSNIKPCGIIARYDLHVYLNNKTKTHAEYFSKKFQAAINNNQLPKLWEEVEKIELNKHKHNFTMANN